MRPLAGSDLIVAANSRCEKTALLPCLTRDFFAHPRRGIAVWRGHSPLNAGSVGDGRDQRPLAIFSFPMGFDQDNTRPIIVTTEKRTTKVNIGIVVGVLLFLFMGAFAMGWIWLHAPEPAPAAAPGDHQRKSP